MKTYFTSESVTCGHPDKVCDQIADAVLDDTLSNDPDAHVACEVTACTGEVHLMGEITSSYVPDYEAIARKVIAEIGYTVPVVGFDAENVRIRVSIHTQSPDIARGVDRGGSRRGRSGYDVRLRLLRDRRADAAADHACEPPDEKARAGAARKAAALSSAGRQGAGQRRV